MKVFLLFLASFLSSTDFETREIASNCLGMIAENVDISEDLLQVIAKTGDTEAKWRMTKVYNDICYPYTFPDIDIISMMPRYDYCTAEKNINIFTDMAGGDKRLATKLMMESLEKEYNKKFAKKHLDEMRRIRDHKPLLTQEEYIEWKKNNQD